MISVFYPLLLVLFALNLSFNAVAIILHDVVATAPVVFKRSLPVFVAVPAAIHVRLRAHRRPDPLSCTSLHEFLVVRAKLLATAAAIARLEVCTDGLVSHPVLKPKPAPKVSAPHPPMSFAD
jgi:hypothetical protein